MNKELLKLYARQELAKREFFYYCNLKAPDFYKKDRKYLVNFCAELQDFISSDDEVLIVNMPPRHGKSRSAGLLVEWILGNNPKEKIMTASYNEKLSTTFSKSVRDSIQEVKADPTKPVYSDIFPGIEIKRGDSSMNMWSLAGNHSNYLSTAPSGTATGFGCTIMIIDDLIKNAEEALNEEVLEKHWSWFTNTMLSRLEEGGKIVIIMTRWASGDLAGRALDHFREIGWNVRHITMKAVQDDGTMLCDAVLSRKSYDMKVKSMGPEIASANYQQEPLDMKGRLYTTFKTYDKLPKDESGNILGVIKSYTDTADTGNDYLCSIAYLEYNKEAYILDVYYTKDAMEVTEPKTAEMFYKNEVREALIESNNGGRGFARNVKRELKEVFKSTRTVIKWFTQSKNKLARIFSSSAWVQEHVYYPLGWENKWPDFHKAMKKYQKEGKNKNDDAPDCITGIAEAIDKGDTYSFD